MEQNTTQNNENEPVQPIMPNQKGRIPSWLGFVMITSSIIILFGGVFAYQYFFIKPAPSVVQAPQVQNPTAGWKTYTNSQYGFEFKYPGDWTLDSKTGEAIIGVWNTAQPTMQGGYPGLRTDDLGISYCDVDCLVKLRLNSNVAIRDYIEAKIKSQSNDTEATRYYSQFTNITIGKNIAGYKWQNMGCGALCSYIISIPQAGGVLNLTSYDFDGPIIKEILSTFKFTTPTDETAGWKTYTDEKYAYEIKYPQDATIELATDTRNGTAPNVLKALSVMELQNKAGIGNIYANLLRIEITGSADTGYAPLLKLAGNKEEKISLLNSEAKKITIQPAESDTGYTYIYINKNDITYILSYAHRKVVDNNDVLFSQIVSTFKFTK